MEEPKTVSASGAPLGWLYLTQRSRFALLGIWYTLSPIRKSRAVKDTVGHHFRWAQLIGHKKFERNKPSEGGRFGG